MISELGRGGSWSRLIVRGRALSVLVAWSLLAAGCGPGSTDDSGPAALPPPVDQSPVVVRAAPVLPAGPPEGCPAISVHCGRTPSLGFDPSGRLWVVFELDGHLYVQALVAPGSGLDVPVRITPEPEAVETNGENRPKIAFGPEGTLHVSWTRKLPGRFTGEVRYVRSVDEGRHLGGRHIEGRHIEGPRTINDDGLPIGHRFEALHVDASGQVYLAWIDKRDREAARERGESFRGASIYSAVSTDRGATFQPNRRLAANACECCRIAAAEGPEGGAAFVWRHVFEPNLRDHAVAVLQGDGVVAPFRRATFEGWRLDGCPHHGPDLTPAPAGYHLVWFTAADDRPRILYGLLPSREGPAAGVVEIVAGGGASHPAVAAVGGRVWVAWKESDGRHSRVMLRDSAGGRDWSPATPIAEVEGPGDHPALVSDGERVWLAWHTPSAGLQLVPLAH